jgi:hypothetical protein
MTTKEILRQVVINQMNELNFQKETVRRELLDKILDFFDDERIIILTGVRRCGKSTLLKQIMQNKSEWCYINFEDERLLDFSAKEFETLNEVLIESMGHLEYTSLMRFKTLRNLKLLSGDCKTKVKK